MKNKVLELLGVNIGEEFFLKEVPNNNIGSYRYRFNKLLHLEKFDDEEGVWKLSNVDLSDIIIGIFAIVKMPISCEVYKAKKHDKCFSISFSQEEAYINENLFDEKDCYDLSKYAFGMVFKTQKEADVMKNIIINKIKESYDNGTPLIDWNEFIAKKRDVKFS